MTMDLANIWIDWLWGWLWQSSLLVAIVVVLDLALRRFVTPSFRLAAWSLVLLKLILPPVLYTPVSLVALCESLATRWNLPWPMFHCPSEALAQQPAIIIALLTIWLIGVVALSVMYLHRVGRLRRDVLDEAGAEPPGWLERDFEAMVRRIKPRKRPRLAVTEKFHSPAVLGVWKPLVVVPRDLVERLGQTQMRHVFAHELMHIERGDLAYQRLAAAVQIMHWINPLAWLVRRRLQSLQEMGCDRATIARLNETPERYRRTILEIVRPLVNRYGAPRHVMGLFGRSSIVARLRVLERHSPAMARPYSWGIALFMVLMKIFVFPMG